MGPGAKFDGPFKFPRQKCHNKPCQNSIIEETYNF